MARSFYWHIHHSRLVEGTSNVTERKRYVKRGKPPLEAPTRLKWMTRVKDQKAVAKLVTFDGWPHRGAKKKLEAIHKREHADCPWNGRTIVPLKVIEAERIRLEARRNRKKPLRA